MIQNPNIKYNTPAHSFQCRYDTRTGVASVPCPTFKYACTVDRFSTDTKELHVENKILRVM